MMSPLEYFYRSLILVYIWKQETIGQKFSPLDLDLLRTRLDDTFFDNLRGGELQPFLEKRFVTKAFSDLLCEGFLVSNGKEVTLSEQAKAQLLGDEFLIWCNDCLQAHRREEIACQRVFKAREALAAIRGRADYGDSRRIEHYVNEVLDGETSHEVNMCLTAEGWSVSWQQVGDRTRFLLSRKS